MFQANTSLLDEETSAEFMKIFGGGRIIDGRYTPLRNSKVKDALRIRADNPILGGHSLAHGPDAEHA